MRFDCGWDGCVNINIDMNGDGNCDFIHICDLPEFIRMLEQVGAEANKFGFDGYDIKGEK